MARIAITGASGFVGSAIVTAGRTAALEVVGLSRRDVPGLRRVVLSDPATISPHLAGAAAVVHAAGLAHVFDAATRDERAFFVANADAPEAVCTAAAAAGVPHVILLSSVAVYGGSEAGGTDEASECRPRGPYAVSKLEGERRAAQVARVSGLNLTILRLATVYGEGDRGNIARLMRAIDMGRFYWIGDGRNRKSLVHRDDVARAVLAVAVAPATGLRTFNLSADPVRMREVVDVLSAALGCTIPPFRIPVILARLAARGAATVGLPGPAETLRKWLGEDRYSSQAFRKTFRVNTSVSLEDGLRRQVDHYRKNVSAHAAAADR